MVGVKVGIITDIHFSDRNDDPDWSVGGSPQEYRRFSTAATRFGQFITTCNAESVDAAVQKGDAIDYTTTPAQRTTEMGNMITQSQSLSALFYNIPGNHENSGFTGEDGNPPVAVYYSIIAGNQGTMENVYTDGDGWKSYSFDVRGVRFLALYAALGGVGEGHLSWLEDRVNETSMPIVVLSHPLLWYPTSEYKHMWMYANNYQDVINILESVKNVQAVICGHYHWNDADSVLADGDIPCISLPGSVLCPNENDNAYYIFEIIPNAVQGVNQMRANIKITGYGSNGTARTKSYDKFAI